MTSQFHRAKELLATRRPSTLVALDTVVLVTQVLAYTSVGLESLTTRADEVHRDDVSLLHVLLRVLDLGEIAAASRPLAVILLFDVVRPHVALQNVVLQVAGIDKAFDAASKLAHHVVARGMYLGVVHRLPPVGKVSATLALKQRRFVDQSW